MKRIVFPVLLVLCVLSLFPTETSSGPQMGQQSPVTWMDLGSGVKVLRVWQIGDSSVWPQVAVLQVPNSFYLKYFQDPQGFMAFVNQNKVFSKDIITPGPWTTLSG